MGGESGKEEGSEGVAGKKGAGRQPVPCQSLWAPQVEVKKTVEELHMRGAVNRSRTCVHANIK